MTVRALSSCVILAASASLLLGCPKGSQEPSGTGAPPPSSGTAAAPSASTPAPQPSASTPPPAPPAPTTEAWVGPWKSASCGARKYVRTLTLAADGSVTGQDLISPCPKGVDCVWSGIVDWKGTYEKTDATIKLDVTINGGPKGKLTLPAELTWDDTAKSVGEKNGSDSCAYEKGGTP